MASSVKKIPQTFDSNFNYKMQTDYFVEVTIEETSKTDSSFYDDSVIIDEADLGIVGEETIQVDLKKSYECDICFKSFTHSWRLSAHKKIHSNIFDFVCKYCGKGFHQKTNLNRHTQAWHLKEKKSYNKASKDLKNQDTEYFDPQKQLLCTKIEYPVFIPLIRTSEYKQSIDLGFIPFALLFVENGPPIIVRVCKQQGYQFVRKAEQEDYNTSYINLKQKYGLESGIFITAEIHTSLNKGQLTNFQIIAPKTKFITVDDMNVRKNSRMGPYDVFLIFRHIETAYPINEVFDIDKMTQELYETCYESGRLDYTYLYP